MRNNVIARLFGMVFLFAILATFAQAQDGKIDNWRPYDKSGINLFEAPKQTDATFDGLKVRIGGAFAQQYQALSHENAADVNLSADGKINLNELYSLGSGFNLATANLNVDVQLDDGIRLAIENYMSSRHHSEFWVKGGYIQVDKLPMFNNPDWFTNNFRVKIGHFQVNYGDQQFRRTDNGNAMYNPFVGNYIMDAFATEIGGELYYFNGNIMAMVGMTSGLIKGDITDGEKAPSIYGKLAYDQQIDDNFRFRLSGSLYHNSNSGRNTLYSGDRAGSRFYMVMAPAYAVPRGGTTPAKTSEGSQFTTGRVNPDFSNKVTAIQINPFLKYQGLEFFATYEVSSGRNSRENDTRNATQVGAELLYRFGSSEQIYLGGRYNSINGEFLGQSDATINRLELTAGWFPTRNLLLKGSIVNQQYNDFGSTNLYHEGQFKGVIVEAVVGF